MREISTAVDSNWIAPLGPAVDQFETTLAQKCSRKYAVALSSGTAALHLALCALDVGPGSIVLVQSFTFVASANPVLYLGATPVFIGSEPTSWNLSPEWLDKALSDLRSGDKLPKAVIAVDLYGMPARYDEISGICAHYGVPLIQDSAESLGSTYKNSPTGAQGAISILSFNGNKIITTSGGGALLTDNLEWAERARFLATQARDQAPHYQHSFLGYNYRMSNLLAAFGNAQLSDLDRRVAARKKNFSSYVDQLKELNLEFQPEFPGAVSNRWLTSALFANHASSESIRLALQAENIESRPLWKPLHLQPLFQACPYYGENIEEDLFSRGLCLPSGSSLTDRERERVVGVIKASL